MAPASMLPDEPNPDLLQMSRILECAKGYGMLEMWDMAWEELEKLPTAARSAPEAIEMRMELHMREKDWDKAAREGLKLQHASPDEPGPFLQTAYCLHEMGQTEAALQTLGRGPASLEGSALFHYNSACYLAVLGEITQAKRKLSIALALEPELEQSARTDPDLANLRGI